MTLPLMSDRLQAKVALHLQMQYDVLARRRSPDVRAVEALYDDAELQNWLDQMAKQNLSPNTGYVNATGGGRG